ncbi:uncharacterized protein FOMMEDRAFT_94731, partial [Fomitiporia mediterranea MF3/22]|uniref:uncharacterized protein n=1 Tax=Fomitiporia mediterranea (strain MF3/22) TaxID=694068 RepID=UPI0004408F87
FPNARWWLVRKVGRLLVPGTHPVEVCRVLRSSFSILTVKRYVDSRLYTHLINAGKYCSSILYYAMYYSWRHHNRAHDYTLVLFCIFGTFASIYTCAWDILMDWSFFKRPAQHRFLRKELVYSNHYYVRVFVSMSFVIEIEKCIMEY